MRRLGGGPVGGLVLSGWTVRALGLELGRELEQRRGW